MKEFSIKLLPNYHRPVIELYGMNTLIDTGAVIPTFSLPMRTLKNLFNAKVILEYSEIKGFGGTCKGKVCSLENFKIGELVFEKIEVFVPNVAVTSHPFLLSSTLFSEMKYSIDTKKLEFSILVNDEKELKRSFFINDLKGKLLTQFFDI